MCKGPLVKVTIRQLPWVAAAQTRSNKVLDLAVLLSAATITLEVYLTLIPLITWSGNEKVALTRLLPHLALSGYVVFALKDLLVSLSTAVACCPARSHSNISKPHGTRASKNGNGRALCTTYQHLLWL